MQDACGTQGEHCNQHAGTAHCIVTLRLQPFRVSCRGWVSLLLLFLAAVLCFFVLLTVSERFFCPALELISEYLRLPPVVAGATLLSFGNGAPDIFTQVAAVGQVGAAERLCASIATC
jgi:sodium/potassium/calcium exchanger 6